MSDERLDWWEVDSPVGRLRLVASERGLCRVHVLAPGEDAPPAARRSAERLRDAARQLAEYFAGRRRSFDLPLAPEGSAFDRATWDALLGIPHGATISYGELARRVGRPGAARAVGGANGRNPIAIIVPCHRVIASDGTLGGYAGGLPMKRKLLELEGALRQASLAG